MTTSWSGGARRAGPTASSRRDRWLRRRTMWLVPGLAIGLFAGVQAEHLAVGLVPLLLFGIAPHLSVLLGWGQPHAPGQLPARARRPFALLHHPLPSVVLIALGVSGALAPFWLVGGMAWLGHIVVDWGLGDGKRDADGYRTSPLARLGRLLDGRSPIRRTGSTGLDR
ncbi:MAG: hypothetical protein KF809_08580 [Chloroflexi bacterium]|nr:hypothetical protein [Chloroflexota bacterium]